MHSILFIEIKLLQLLVIKLINQRVEHFILTVFETKHQRSFTFEVSSI